VLALLASAAAAATPPVSLEADKLHYDLSDKVEYLVDTNGSETITSLHAGARAADWKHFDRPLPNFGFTKSTYWIRLSLDNPSGRHIETVLAFRYPLLDYVNVYLERKDGAFDVRKMGDRLPYSQRAIRHTQHIVVVSVDARQRRWIYARIRTLSSMQPGVTLDSYGGFLKRTSRQRLFYGMYYGIMLAMALYNLFLFLAIRDRTYLFYVAFVVVFTSTQLALDGVAARYLFPEMPGFSNLFTPLVVGGAQPLAILFSQSFLETRERSPRVHKALNYYLAFASLGIPLALFTSYHISIRFVAITAIVTAIVSQIAGIIIHRGGFRPARFFNLAWGALVLGTVVYVLMVIGVLPANALTIDSQRIGSALEVTLLSFALGDRIKITETEREAAQARAIALDQDLALSGAVQQLFLPQEHHVLADDLELMGFYRPAARCGGDWWWHERTINGALLVVLGDVTGHGAGAAMLTGAVASSFRTLPVDQRARPHGLLEGVDERFRGIAGGTEHHMTMVAFTVDATAAKIEMCNAGAPPLFVMHSDETVTPMVAPGSLIGADDLVIGDADMALRPGDRIFAFSDGLPELTRRNGRQLGYAGVKRLLQKTAGLTIQTARDTLVDALDGALGTEHQEDDYSFVLIDVRTAS